MSVIYEERIREVEEMIDSIKELQEIKIAQQKNITDISRELEAAGEMIKGQGRDIERQGSDIQRQANTIDNLTQENMALKAESSHWREEGNLTDSDLRTLKE